MTANSQACERCLTRSLRCIDQEHGLSKAEMLRKKKKLQVRQVGLQDLITQVLNKLPPNAGQAHGSKAEMAAVNALKKLQEELPQRGQTPRIALSPLRHGAWDPHGSFDTVPLLSLLKNDALGEGQYEEGILTESPFGNEEQLVIEKENLATELKAVVPNTHDMSLLIESGQAVWRIWQRAFPEIGLADIGLDGECNISGLQSHINSVAKSNEAIAIVKVLLCSALSAQQLTLSSDLKQTRLSISSKELQRQFLTPVETYLKSDEASACSLEGLQCMLIQARIYVNEGLPHKAWLTFRRAIPYAQLMGLHRQPIDSEEVKPRQKQALWMQIWQGERYLSLILGLPYSAAENLYDLEACQKGGSKVPNGEYLLHRLGTIAGKIIDRDQRSTRPDFVTTIQIDQDLEECKNSVPKAWWDATIGPEMSLASAADMLSAKFAYQNTRKLLHLPFMLQSKADLRYEYSRIAALEASREMIKYYQIMRDPDRPLFTICNLADFQVFTAAMILILDMLGQVLPLSTGPASGQAQGDWGIILGIMDVLKRVSKDSLSGVATQAAQILEDMYRFRFEISSYDGEEYHAVIPYFGKLSIRMRKMSQVPELEQMAPEEQDKLDGAFNAATTFDHRLDYQNFYFESYMSLPEGDQPWQNMGADWNSTTDFNLCDDWSTFLCNDEFA
jgi:hypothetical protein